MVYILVAALTFGALFLIDKGFAKVFRSKAQHQSGHSVRLKKSYGIAAVLLGIVAVLCLIQFVAAKMPMMLVCGVLIGALSIGIGGYYLTHGIFYDGESFLYTNFGRNGTAYRYADITGQKLYRLQGGSLLVELYMADGRTVSVQTAMPGAYDFLDKAAHARFRQLGQNSAEYDWFNEDNSCWFPPMED